LILDYGDWYNNSHTLMFMNLCKSDSIDILRTSGNIAIIDSLTKTKKYSEVIVLHATDELIRKLQSRHGTSLDSLDIALWPPVYEVITENTGRK
jgi:hypothetical protein